MASGFTVSVVPSRKQRPALNCRRWFFDTIGDVMCDLLLLIMTLLLLDGWMASMRSSIVLTTDVFLMFDELMKEGNKKGD